MRVECGRVEADIRSRQLAAAVTGIMSLHTTWMDLHREMESSYYSFPCRESRYLEIGTLVPNLSLNPFRPAEAELDL